MNYGTLFSALFLGHLAGDYMFQDDYMARNKVKSNMVGWTACLLHCIFYTASVILSLKLFGFKVNAAAAAMVFLSHFPIDKWSIGKKWMTVYGQSMDPKTNPFVPCVYIAIDNGMHLMLMMWWLGMTL